jgi:hypothetical protein
MAAADPKKTTPAKKTDPPAAVDERPSPTGDVPPLDITPPDLDAPTVSAPPASMDEDAVQSATSPLDPTKLAVEDETPVTMADVAALNGIGLAPDESDARVAPLTEDGDVFISAGMQSDLEQQGWALDPTTGRKVVREDQDKDKG